jgi:hypothetical protein
MRIDMTCHAIAVRVAMPFPGLMVEAAPMEEVNR